jgi:hypothetical protein
VTFYLWREAVKYRKIEGPSSSCNGIRVDSARMEADVSIFYTKP